VSTEGQHAPTQVSAQHGVDRYDDLDAVRALVDETIAALKLPDDYVRPGDRVVLKPNWVKEHDERHPGPDQWEHVVTHPAVIEAVIRWVAGQLNGVGSIIVCDAPQTDSSFATLSDYCGLDEMIGRCRADFPGSKIELLDLRPEEWHAVDGVTVSKTQLPGDPLGDTFVALNEASEFVGFSGNGQLYGASFNMDETNERHRGERHEYMLCRTPMDADVFINLPKLKTHKKVGLTCALKNLVGINANKNWLPHHTEGTPDQGGDQFPAATTKAKLEHSWMGRAKRVVYGKPLLSRMLVPLKKIGRLFFGDTQKVVRSGNKLFKYHLKVKFTPLVIFILGFQLSSFIIFLLFKAYLVSCPGLSLTKVIFTFLPIFIFFLAIFNKELVISIFVLLIFEPIL